MRHAMGVGFGGVVACVLLACGGAVDLKTDADPEQGLGGAGDPPTATNGGVNQTPSGGRAGSDNGGSGTSGGTAPGGGTAPVGGTAPSGGSGSIVEENGWRWDLHCPSSVASYCAEDGAICVPHWDEASDIQAWCDDPNVSDFAYVGSCNGYNVVAVFGIDTVGPDPQLFNYYFYDLTTGALVHVDSDRIPSFTQCVAGKSGLKHDVFGCDSQVVACR